MKLHTWESLTPDGGVLALKYSFGMATANTLAVRLDDGSWLLVSPPLNAPTDTVEELAKQGPVKALLANNGFHHLGQPAWRERFPEATSYAPEGSLARLAKKAQGIPFRPLAELLPRLGSRIETVIPGGMKQPDLLVRVAAGDVSVWFTGDLISNTVKEDISVFPRLLMGLFGGGPGYKLNPVPAMAYLKDRAAWRAEVRRRLADAPPTIVLPGHGEPVDNGVAQRTLALFD